MGDVRPRLGGRVKPYSIDGVARPLTRAECKDGPRPCPWVSCRHHLLLEVASAKPKAGRDARATTIRLNRPNTGGSGDVRMGRRPGLDAGCPDSIVRAWIDDASDRLDAMPYTCTLDVVEDYPDGAPLPLIAELLGVTDKAVGMELAGGVGRDELADFADYAPADRYTAIGGLR